MNPEKKAARYRRIYTQLQELLLKSDDTEARMATVIAVLHHKMDNFFWTGFYMLNNGKLIVHKYQGPVACMELKQNTGVCWAGIKEQKTIVVPDVHQFPGHIACDSRSNSEIVVPFFSKEGEIIGVLDIDSQQFSNFDSIDAEWLEKILKLI